MEKLCLCVSKYLQKTNWLQKKSKPHTQRVKRHGIKCVDFDNRCDQWAKCINCTVSWIKPAIRWRISGKYLHITKINKFWILCASFFVFDSATPPILIAHFFLFHRRETFWFTEHMRVCVSNNNILLSQKRQFPSCHVNMMICIDYFCVSV